MYSSHQISIEAPASVNFQVKPAAAQLMPWVELYYSMKRLTTDLAAPVHNLYPDGGSTLVFEFSDDQAVRPVINLHRSRQKRRFIQPQDCVAIRFRPGGAFALLGLSAPEIADAQAAELAGQIDGLSELCEKLSVSTLSQRIHFIETFLLSRVRHYQAKAGVVQQWLAALPTSPHEIRQQLQRKVIHRRRLERIFHLETGFSPGTLFNLRRLKTVRNALVTNPNVPLASVAQQYGFYDQAYFIHQFSRATGDTPGRYRRRKVSQFYNPK